MFEYSPSDTSIPSLTFTKAELVYAMAFLMKDLKPSDNNSRIELVELRFYLNKIRDVVARAAASGVLERAMPPFEEAKVNPVQRKAEAKEGPSMGELRKRFPTLTDDEIREVLEKVRKEREKEDEEKKKDTSEDADSIPSPPSFIAKQVQPRRPIPQAKPMTPKEAKDRENSEKFASMLGLSSF